MAEVEGGGGVSSTWQDEMASLVEDNGIRRRYGYAVDPIEIPTPAFDAGRSGFVESVSTEESPEKETLRDQVTGFLTSWGEMLVDLGRGCRDIVQQNLFTEDSFLVQKLSGPMEKVSCGIRYLNDSFLPEDRDPAHAWPVILFVFILALAALNVNNRSDSLVLPIKKVHLHPPSANRIQLPDGRYMAYHELGVSADRARFTMIAPHAFLSSRLTGIPGIKTSLLEEFGVRLVTYDLPGFGESDPHSARNLNSSAVDMLNLANGVGINDKFWVLGYSSGSMHAWAALRYIPSRIAGAAMIAPLINPYEPGMFREEMRTTWEHWQPRKKLMFVLARRFPKILSFFYRRSFLSGNHGQIDKWMSVSFGQKDGLLIEEPIFEEFWHRDVEESIRQGSTKPFIEEAVQQVSAWGFSLIDLQVQKKCQRKGILPWLSFMYSQEECELTGFLGPIHVWQGMDDRVVPPSMADYISRVLPGANMHKLPNEGHFSYFFFCDECHRQIFSTLFGSAQGPLDVPMETQMKLTPNENSASLIADSSNE
ncbi:hypothetical protein HS088_TW05G00615 [Tripterygium wilfordii]|uniref:AB hydrolase-1 domain-containing protein n=1 Tax=Tripterygium wilfordii TaxID=458696 RepID=A0A7J7DNE5_TRIWF|nr:uncharacterized protein LOC119998953 [Tripterygium wilfordii]KAF5747885.1 hypothetical protein HS088_TW05G00615 [Tripterygium wilfordii]